MDSVNRVFSDLLLQHKVTLSDRQLEQFECYFDELVSWNERMNLTAIKERDQVYIKHFYDSVSLSFYFPLFSIHTVADIGSGAGFPSIPLKIVFPHLKVTIIDSLNKRIQFLNHLTKQLGLSDVQCIHGRAEDLARQSQHRDHYELVTARAVARLNVLNEFCLPFVKKGGTFIAMKGSDPRDELAEAKYSMKQLHAKLREVYSFELPIEQSNRHLIVLTKTQETPAKYPRKSGIPIRSPLT